jgi:DNA replication protein DnaC
MRLEVHYGWSITSNRPIDDWGKILGDNAAVTAMLDRLQHHAHIIKTKPKSRRTWEFPTTVVSDRVDA